MHDVVVVVVVSDRCYRHFAIGVVKRVKVCETVYS